MAISGWRRNIRNNESSGEKPIMAIISWRKPMQLVAASVANDSISAYVAQ